MIGQTTTGLTINKMSIVTVTKGASKLANHIYSFHSGASARSGEQWVIKFGKLSIRENLVMTSPYVRPYGRSG